jgi:di/tricarboxylate transporter
VVLRICQNTGLAPSRLMMPLSFAALISGMLTLVATAPNLVVNAELVRQGEEGFHFFSVTPFGVPVLILGIVYMLFARRWLAAGTDTAASARRRPSLRDWIEQYQLADREYRARVTSGSPLVGKRLEELSLRSAGVNLLAIERGDRLRKEIIRPEAGTELQAGDVLLIDVRAPEVEIEALRQRFALEPLPLGEARGYLTDRAQEIGMVEVLVPAESKMVGHTVLEARVCRDYGLTVIGLRRGQSVHGHGLLEEELKIGDALLLVGFWKDIERLQSEGADLVVLNTPVELHEVLPAASKAPHALAVLALVVGLMISGSKRARRTDRLPAAGPARLCRHEQRLSLDQLEEPGPDRRDATLLDRLTTHRRRRSGGRCPVGPGRRGLAAARACDPLRDHGASGLLHFQHRDGGADGAGCARHRCRARGVPPTRSR